VANFDPVVLALTLALLALAPLTIVVTTSFLKIAVVMSLLRNALGVQQIPPNLAIYALSLILSIYIMAPIGERMLDAVRAEPAAFRDLDAMVGAVKKGAEPLRGFLVKHSKPQQREFFVRTAQRMWTPEMAANVKADDYLVLVPAFVVTELTAAFEIGFLLYLPFVVIDLVVSNILLAMGMMMVSPVTISLPLKLFLFVLVDGWSRLIHGLVLTYA
jgi:type III secretion protein R